MCLTRRVRSSVVIGLIVSTDERDLWHDQSGQPADHWARSDRFFKISQASHHLVIIHTGEVSYLEETRFDTFRGQIVVAMWLECGCHDSRVRVCPRAPRRCCVTDCFQASPFPL